MSNFSDLTKVFENSNGIIAETNKQIRNGIPPLLPEIQMIALNSVMKNFMVGGRYGDENFGGGNKTWKPSKRATGEVKKATGLYKSNKKKYSKTYGTSAPNSNGKTLLDTGKLRNSIRCFATFDGKTIRLTLTSDLVYAAAQHYGISSRNLPARPYLVLQQSDINRIIDLIVDKCL